MADRKACVSPHSPHRSDAAPGSPSDSGLPAPSPSRTAPASDRVRLRRRRERGSHDRRVIDAILDEALIAHLGIADEDGQPLVIPTLHARCGDFVYLHEIGRAHV